MDTTNEPVAITQAEILGILQDAYSVPLGQPIFNSSEEYNKLKAIIESAIRYTHPVKELNDGGEPVKNATYWKRQYNLMATQNDNLKSGLYHANEQIKYLEGQLEVAQQLTKMRLENSAPSVKELTDEEIVSLYESSYLQSGLDEWEFDPVYFARAILRKAQEK